MSRNDIVSLNVGGVRFCTSRETLLSVPGSFFTSLLSDRIPSAQDETGATFIDRDPTLFSVILNYLRTKKLDLRGQSASALRSEAEFYGLTPLAKTLLLAEEHSNSSCGDILFYSYLPPPNFEDLPADFAVSTSWGAQLSRVTSQSAWSRLENEHDPVLLISGHHNFLTAAYARRVCCYRRKESSMWDLVFVSPALSHPPGHLAVNAKVSLSSQPHRFVAISSGGNIVVWNTTAANASSAEVAKHDLGNPVDALFFIGNQLVALNSVGKVAVWNSMTRHWKVQMITPITSHDMAGSSLLLGCANGKIFYIDMEKFPLRMKDNDLLVTQLYEDPCREAVTALSVYFTPKICANSNWLEIGYGTASGTVRVIVEHPETLGQGFQLLQTFTVHRSPIIRVVLGEKHLVSVCSEFNHVRTWTVTRFRGCLSTQPGSLPLASFNVMSLEAGRGTDAAHLPACSNSIGPFGDHDSNQVFIQHVVPVTRELYIRLSSTGKRVCVLRSVDNSVITAHCIHEFDPSSRSRRYIVTGHSNGALQMWDLTTALERAPSLHSSQGLEAYDMTGGPNQAELLSLLEQFELRPSLSLQSSRAPSERSLYGSLRHMHSASPSPQLQHTGTSAASPKHHLAQSLPVPHQLVPSAAGTKREAEKQEQQSEELAGSGVDMAAHLQQSHTSESDNDGQNSPEVRASQQHTEHPRKQSGHTADASPPLLKSMSSTSALPQFEYPPTSLGSGERSRAASMSGSSVDLSASAAAARAAMLHESPYLRRASSSVSSPSLPQHAAVAEIPAATVSSSRVPAGVNAHGHRRSSSVSLRRQGQTQGTVRHSFSAGEVSAPLRAGSTSADRGGIGGRLQDRSNIALVRPSVQLMSDSQRSQMALYGSLPSSSVLDDRFISHC